MIGVGPQSSRGGLPARWRRRVGTPCAAATAATNGSASGAASTRASPRSTGHRRWDVGLAARMWLAYEPMRVLHTPTNTGAHPMGLSLAERELGLNSEVVTFDPNRFGFPVDRSLFREGAPLWRTVPERLGLLLEVVRHVDVIHFNFGSTILPGWGHLVALDELPLLRRLGKTVVATFQGDDARPPDYWSAPPPPEAWRGIELRRSHARERL